MSLNNSSEEYALDLLAETDYAFMVCDGFVTCWIPKSQVEVTSGPTKPKVGRMKIVLDIPDWLAEEKDLA